MPPKLTGGVDPKNSDNWRTNRILRPVFLEAILLHELIGVPCHTGVRILGGWFKEALNLSHAALPHQIWLDASRFESDVNLDLLQIPLLSLEGSTFTAKLTMEV